MRETFWRTPKPFGQTLLYADCVSPSTISTLNAASPTEQKAGAHQSPGEPLLSQASYQEAPLSKKTPFSIFQAIYSLFSPNSTGLKNSFIIDCRLRGEVTELTNYP